MRRWMMRASLGVVRGITVRVVGILVHRQTTDHAAVDDGKYEAEWKLVGELHLKVDVVCDGVADCDSGWITG